jgi:hypothetical protein
MNYKIYRHVPPQRLRALIPKRYHPQIIWSDLGDAEAVLLLFAQGPENVVLSSVVLRAVASLSDLNERSRIAIAGCLTAEAAKVLTGFGFRSYTLNEFSYWTDESFKRITKATA